MSWIPSYKKPSGGGGEYVPPTWADGTDEEIVEALEKHYAGEIDLTEYWGVGDTRNVTLSAMSATGVGESHTQQTVTFVLSNIGGKTLSDGTTTCVFQVDQLHCLNEKGYMNDWGTNSGGWRDCRRRTWCNSTYYNSIPSTLRPIFKQFNNKSGQGDYTSSGTYNTTDYFALRAEIEVFGSTTYSVSGEGSQVTWYETSINQKKNANGDRTTWWDRSPAASDNTAFCCNLGYGSWSSDVAYLERGISPFGVI